MSSLSSDSEPADTAKEILAHNYLHLFAISLLFYDHLITSSNEIDHLWRRRKQRSAYLFFLNRYTAFFGNIAVTVLAFTTLSTESCKRYNLFRQLFLIFNQVLVCILLTLRIYALYSCSVRILAYMVGSGGVLASVSFYALFGQKISPANDVLGCHIGYSRVTAIRLASAWEALFIYDSIIFGMMVVKTWKNRNEFTLVQRQMSMLSLIYRDGAIYFAVMALANLANIMTFYFCGPYMTGGLSTFASAISVTMTSRLMLNLHEMADEGIYSTTRTTDTSTNIECRTLPGDVELDTIWSGDMQRRSVMSAGNSRLDEGTAPEPPPQSPHVPPIATV